MRRYQRPVISLVARLVGDRALAEDLAQETFVKAYRSLAAFDTTRRLSSWLFRIAHNTAIDSLRRLRALPALEAAEDAPPGTIEAASATTDADPVEREALGRALSEALQRLRPEYRTAVILRYEEGLAFDEIGHVLGVAEATARSHVHRARKELTMWLSAAGWSPAATRNTSVRMHE